LAYHYGGEVERFAGGADWWNQSMPAGLRWDATGGSQHGFNVSAFNATGWPASPRPRPWLHAMHASEWGGHVWEVNGVDVGGRTFRLGRGGWQEARYISIGATPFYVEGARTALDAQGEWWHDEAGGRLHLIPNATLPPAQAMLQLVVALPRLAHLIEVNGTAAAPARAIAFEGLTFAHTRRTMLERYIVPSSGDWSVYAGGALTAEGTDGLAVTRCTFNRTGGHAIALVGGNARAAITHNEMVLLGDSGVVLVGRLPGVGYNGSEAATGSPTPYPADTLIASNHFRGLGLWGKQSAALFQAVSCRTTFSGNVAYNGPRAAVNINDGFCGGTSIASNVLFNWVRETQDHGPGTRFEPLCSSHPCFSQRDRAPFLVWQADQHVGPHRVCPPRRRALPRVEPRDAQPDHERPFSKPRPRQLVPCGRQR
jgi:hypothetical protein